MVTLTVSVAPKFHINAHQPGDPNMIATVATVNAPKYPGVSVGKVVYPAGETMKVEYSPKPLRVYEGMTRITVPVAIAKTAKPGTVTLTGQVRMQGCDETACYPPATLKFSAPLQIVAKVKGAKP
jgi:DsbC/DsbD-like thiol-disulfide interchange protein